MADVLLINPGCEGEGGQSAFPLGLGYIASVLKARGYSVALLDLDIEELKIDLVKKAKVVGIVVMSSTLRAVWELVHKIRQHTTEPEIVVGGPHVTEDPRIIIDLGVRYGIRGDADYSFASLCDSIITSKEGYAPGLITNDLNGLGVGDKVVIEDLDSLPPPTRYHIGDATYRFTPVIASRGCPFNCTFCSMGLTNYRCRSPECVFSEIGELQDRYNTRRIDFVDDVFTLNEDNVMRLCELFKESKVDIKWSCTTRADLVDEGMLKEMYDSGLWFMSFGVESGVEDIRRVSGKDILNECYETVFECCRRIGIKTRAYGVFGHPEERVVDMVETVSFMKKLRPDYAVFRVMDLIPGSILFKRAVSEEKIDGDCWKTFMFGGEYPIYLPINVSKEEVYDIYNEACSSFYPMWKCVVDGFLNIKLFKDVISILGRGNNHIQR